MCSFWAVASLVLGTLAFGAKGQTVNYLIDALEASNELREKYSIQVHYWRGMLSDESEDVGFLFTDLAADLIALSSTAAQGAIIAECFKTATYNSKRSMEALGDTITRTEEAANVLHLSVIKQLSELNVKEHDMEIFYYYHSNIINNAHYELWNVHEEAMFLAWFKLNSDFFYNSNLLYNCTSDLFPNASE